MSSFADRLFAKHIVAGDIKATGCSGKGNGRDKKSEVRGVRVHCGHKMAIVSTPP